MDEYLVFVRAARFGDHYYTSLTDNYTVEADMDPAEFHDTLKAGIDHACREQLGTAYVERAFAKADVVMVLMNVGGGGTGTGSNSEVDASVEGFVFARDIPDSGGIDADVVCAAKHGGRLLEKFIDYCREHAYSYIELSALPNVLGFYHRYGFRFRGNCNPRVPADAELTKEMSDRLRRTTDAYGDHDIFEFIYALHTLGYTPLTAPYACYNTRMTRDEFVDNRCVDNGIEMRLCLVENADEPVVQTKTAAKLQAAAAKLFLQKKQAQKTLRSLTRTKTRKGSKGSKGFKFSKNPKFFKSPKMTNND